jgi:hypothetical protein
LDGDAFRAAVVEAGVSDKKVAEAAGKIAIALNAKREEAARVANEAQADTWRKEFTSRPGYQEELKYAKVALTKFFSPELRESMSKMDHPPAVLDALAKIGRAVSEGAPLPQGNPPAAKKAVPFASIYTTKP